MTKSLETYKLGVVLEVHGKKGLATIELNDKALQKLSAQADKTGKSLTGSLGAGLREIGSNLANIKAGLDIARDVGGFIFGIARQAADAGSKFHDLSVQTGASVETFSGLQRTLKQSGTDMDALSRGVVVMQRNLGEAASGNKELQCTFAALGIKDVRAALADTDGTLRTVAKSLANTTDAGLRNAQGSKVMGKGYKDLSVFIAEAGGNLDEIIEQARQAGQVMSDEAADAADAFGDQLDALSDAAAVAGRTVGLEAIPQITGAMRDLTGATEENASTLKAWGQQLGRVIQFARIAAESIAAFSIFDTNISYQAKVKAIADRIAREDEIAAGKRFDLNAPVTSEQKARGARERARALGQIGLRPAVGPAGEGGDFFAAGGGGRKAVESAGEKARKKFVDTLHEWADTFNIPRSALRAIGSQSKVHKGWAHKAGMATDISPQYMTPAAIEGARQMGLNVIPELYTGNGPNGYSTGPHYHIQAMTKATQAQSKVYEEQETVLDSLARKIAEAESSVRALSQSGIEQELASTRMSLGLHKLEGPLAELAEAMMQDLEAQLKARDAGKEHEEALASLKSIVSSTSAEVLTAASAQDVMTAALRRAEVPLAGYQGQWARLVATMKDVGPLIQDLAGSIAPAGLVDGPALPEGPTVAPPLFKSEDAPDAPKPDKMRQVWKELTTLGDESHRLQFAFRDLFQSLQQQQQQQGGKRGFFSKLLGMAAPFLNFIPVVGPILSMGATIASRALAGDYMGAALGAAGGLAPGGAFRGSGGGAGASGAPSGGVLPNGVGVGTSIYGGERALGGPVTRGRAYLVGELRPEVFTPEEDGWIHPSTESYARSRGAGSGGGGRQGRGPMGGVLASVLDKIEAHFARLDAVSMDHVYTTGARRNPGATADSFMRGAARDPRVTEWMQRRTQPQAA